MDGKGRRGGIGRDGREEKERGEEWNPIAKVYGPTSPTFSVYFNLVWNGQCHRPNYLDFVKKRFSL